jgi:hypothetical protein
MSQDDCDCCDNCAGDICGQEMTCERCNEPLGCQKYFGSCNNKNCEHKYEHLCNSCGEIDPETDDAICNDCVEVKEEKQRIAKAIEEAKAVLIKAGIKTPTNIQILKQRKLMGC